MHSTMASFNLCVFRPLGRIHATPCTTSRYFSTAQIHRFWSQAIEASKRVGSAKSDTNETDRAQSVIGTAPYHTSYTLLRHPMPPSTYPPKLDETFSPLGRELARHAVRSGGLVNFWWEGGEDGEEGVPRAIEESREGEGEKEEQYPFLTFTSDLDMRTNVRTGIVTTSNVNLVFDSPLHASDAWVEKHGVFLFVCTHGSRDCRCGDGGSAFVAALRAELDARRSQVGADGVWKKIRVGEVAHVGGHKYAANLLAFPFGDWLGQLTPGHAPLVLDAISSRLRILHNKTETQRENTDERALSAPLILDKTIWRGRMGLKKEEQLRLFQMCSTTGTE